MIRITGANYLAGIQSKKGIEKFVSLSPLDDKKERIPFFNATKKEIKKAVNEADKSYPIISNYNDEKIVGFLKTLSDEIINLGHQLIKECHWETGLGKNRLMSERTRTCNQLQMFADYVSKGSYVEAIIDKKCNSQPDIRRMLMPIGPVVVFPASNFPFAFGVCGGDSASAWAAKCPVIIKAHPLHPKTSELFSHAVYESIEKNGLPKGFFSLIHGNNNEVAQELVLHPKIKAVGFTGSISAGRALYNLSAKRDAPIPVFAEMGSINPVFITKKAMQRRNSEIAQSLSTSITAGSGQFCTKPGVIFVNDDPYSNEFIQKLKECIKKKDAGVLIDKRIKEALEKNIDRSKRIDGIEILFGGEPVKDKTSFQNTLFVTDSASYSKEKQIQREHFGPAAFIVRCKNFEEYLTIVEQLEGELTATIFLEKEDFKMVKQLISMLTNKVGRLIINGVPTGVRVCNAMQHGGPYPATTFTSTTSVGTQAIKRFLRPVAFQDFPDELLPIQIKDKNQKNILRYEDGKFKNS